MPLNILRKVKKPAYLTLIALYCSLKVSKKLNSSGVLKSDYELKIQKQRLRLRFMWTILIHIYSAFKYTQDHKQDHKFRISHC